jgi:DNA mismatch repair ATPase MutS
MQIDMATRRNLELTRSLTGGTLRGAFWTFSTARSRQAARVCWNGACQGQRQMPKTIATRMMPWSISSLTCG